MGMWSGIRYNVRLGTGSEARQRTVMCVTRLWGWLRKASCSLNPHWSRAYESSSGWEVVRLGPQRSCSCHISLKQDKRGREGEESIREKFRPALRNPTYIGNPSFLVMRPVCESCWCKNWGRGGRQTAVWRDERQKEVRSKGRDQVGSKRQWQEKSMLRPLGL